MLLQCRWCRGSPKQDGDSNKTQDKPYRILHETNQKQELKKYFIPIPFSRRSSDLISLSIIASRNNSNKSDGYSWIKDKNYAEIHFTKSLKTCLIR